MSLVRLIIKVFVFKFSFSMVYPAPDRHTVWLPTTWATTVMFKVAGPMNGAFPTGSHHRRHNKHHTGNGSSE